MGDLSVMQNMVDAGMEKSHYMWLCITCCCLMLLQHKTHRYRIYSQYLNGLVIGRPFYIYNANFITGLCMWCHVWTSIEWKCTSYICIGNTSSWWLCMYSPIIIAIHHYFSMRTINQPTTIKMFTHIYFRKNELLY